MADDSMAEIGRDGRSVIRTGDKLKGRGAKPEAEAEDVDERYVGKSGMFDSLGDEPGAGPQRCEASFWGTHLGLRNALNGLYECLSLCCGIRLR
jgi:hypothetical protein